MHRLIAVLLLFVLWLIPSSVLAKPYTQARPAALHLVQKIYIDEMGTSAEAARFRLLLEDQLTRKGFTVVDRRENADAVLGGALSVAQSGIYGGPADVSVTARLISSGGERLWSTNIGGQITILNPITSLRFNDPVEYRARELAKRLRGDWEKSAKTAGVKIRR